MKIISKMYLRIVSYKGQGFVSPVGTDLWRVQKDVSSVKKVYNKFRKSSGSALTEDLLSVPVIIIIIINIQR